MLARYFLFISVSLALFGVGCAAGDDLRDPSAQPGEEGGRLVNEGDTTLHVLPNGTEPITVRYLDDADEPVAGEQLEFSFLGVSGSAFLPTERPVTDSDGRATTTLSIGSNPPPEFSVRVSAQGVEPLLIKVYVVDAKTISLSVEAHYLGERDVESRTVSKLAQKTCSEALAAGVAGDVTFSYDDPEHRAVFELAPGVHYAILAWGRDSTNAKVAVGCGEFSAPVDPKALHPALRVELNDIPMSPASHSYELNLDLDVSLSVARLHDVIRSRADEDFPDSPDSTAQGDFFVQALEAELADRELDDTVPAELGQKIETALDAANKGLAAYAYALADALSTFGSHVKLHANYGIGAAVELPMSIVIDLVHVRNEDDTVTLLLNGKDSVYVPPLASIEASYSDAWGALDVQALSLSQGLGGYGKAVIAALRANDPTMLDDHAGCMAVGKVLASQVAQCDEACRAATCERALANLRMTLRADLAAFDVSHPTIGLTGKLFVHDRTDDGIVDDVGPADLSGNWGTSEVSDSVTGHVLAPVTTVVR
jgi:hypothetical protein